MKRRMQQLACLCLMLLVVAPLRLRAQDKPEARPQNARRADELDSLKQGKLAWQHEKLAREMEEMGERLRFELVPELEELRDALPDLHEELAPRWQHWNCLTSKRNLPNCESCHLNCTWLCRNWQGFRRCCLFPKFHRCRRFRRCPY